mgnify:CR=1 FL=1
MYSSFPVRPRDEAAPTNLIRRMNESDLAKIHMSQRCRVSPEAYLERHYDCRVVEIAPEANRQKGTLQIKVQIQDPDKFLTPELSAKVEFLANSL